MLNNQYFLVLKELNLYPSLSPDSIEMIEQVMNGVILVSLQNLQDSINRLITLEVTCKPILDQEYTSIIHALQPLAQSYGAPIVDARVANSYIIHHYNNRLKHYSNDKLDDINHQFSSFKKISYDGNRVEFLPTFFDWVYEMVHQQHTFIVHNPADELMNEHLFPDLTPHIQGAIDTIEEHTHRYADEIRNKLFNIRKSLS